EQLSGEGRFHLDIQYGGEAAPAWRHQVRAEIQNGRLVHRQIPFPVENIELAARCDDGQVTIDSLSATSGPARLTAKARIDTTAPQTVRKSSAATDKSSHPETLLSGWLDSFRSLEFAVTDWPLTLDQFDRLPAAFAVYRQRFAPTGTLDIGGRLERTANGWTAAITLHPTDMTFRFESFPYPLERARGRLVLALGGGRPSRLDVELNAEANDHCPVAILGHVGGNGPD